MPIWLEAIVVLVVALLFARIVKRGSKFLQRYFIPSALVGGFGALLLSHQLLGWVPKELTDEWSAYPKFLINVVFAGLFLGHIIPGAREIWLKSAPMIAFGNTLAWGQYVIGIALTLVVLGPVFGAPALTGALIEVGFEGGHGTAAGLAPTFEKLGWPEATDIALGLATISIVVAIFSGILIINIHHRKNGRVLGEAAMKEQQKRMIRSGYSLTRFANRLETSPREVIVVGLLFAASIGIGWIILQSLILLEGIILGAGTDVRFFEYLPLFPLAMIGGIIVQFTLNKLRHGHIVKRNTVKVFSALALDLLILSAIATLSIGTIRDNFAIFIILALAGIIWIIGAFFFLAPRFFRRHWFEYGLTNSGQSMGMTATGLLMNRLVDPNNHTHARESFAYKQLAFEPFMGGGLVTASAAIVLVEMGQIPTLLAVSIIFIFWLWLGLKLGQKPRVSRCQIALDKSLGKAATKVSQ
jgi:ESS family glutamate:Na+ symporter